MPTFPPHDHEEYNRYEEILDSIHPFNLMRDVNAFLAWFIEVGSDEYDRVVKEATRKAMEEHGVRIVIIIGDRMQNMTARMEEMSDH